MKKYIWLFSALILADTITKLWAENALMQEIIIIPHVLAFQYAQNIGIAFSIPLTGIALKVITVILIFGIFWYYYTSERQKKSTLVDISYTLIFAGAIGNAWERIFRSYVTDFISLEHFAIFNLADSYISLWAMWLIYYYIKYTS